MSTVSDLVNGWGGGIIQASRHSVFVTPAYPVNALFASHLAHERLASTPHGPKFDSTLEGSGISTVDAVASRSENGKDIFIKIVNSDPSESMPTNISVRGVHVANQARVDTLSGNGLTVSSDFAHPDEVRTTTSEFTAGRSFTVILPEPCVSVIAMEADR
jgi:alpha-N-arabinofuranosidase